MTHLWKVAAFATVLAFSAPIASAPFFSAEQAEAASTKKAGKKQVKKAKKKVGKKAKVRKAKKAAAWKHCGTFMYHDKKGKCADARVKK